MEVHLFIAHQVAPDAVAAGCSCGWASPYSHAYEKYAVDDHTAHVEFMGGKVYRVVSLEGGDHYMVAEEDNEGDLFDTGIRAPWPMIDTIAELLNGQEG